MILYGLNPVVEALRSHPARIRWIAVSRGPSDRLRRVVEEARQAGVPLRQSDRQRLDRLVPKGAVHNGVVAEVSSAEYADFETVVAQPQCRLVVFLDGIRDPQNLGAVLRVADALGVDLVVVPEHESAGLTAAAVKASAGASEWIPVAQVTNLSRAIERLKDLGFWIYGTDAEGDPVTSVELTGRLGIVLGSEQSGMRRNVRAHCDGVLAVPLRGHLESLNVSTAAAIVLWEIARRRL